MKDSFQGQIIVYSTNWAEGAGVATLSSEKDVNNNHVFNVTTVVEQYSFLCLVDVVIPDFIVLNISPREHVSLICYLRYRFKSLPIIITQKRFLFSDRTLAEYFGFVWLLEYDALLSGYPETSLTKWVTDCRFAGTSAGGIAGRSLKPIPCMTLEEWLKYRLEHLTGSSLVTDIALNWLARGYSVSETSRAVLRTDKLIYHYRRKIMRALNIRNHIIDFIPSLSFSGNPVGRLYAGDIGGIKEKESVR